MNAAPESLPAGPVQRPLRRAFVRGLRWTMLATGLGAVVSGAQQIALARLLTPQDFAVVGLAAPFLLLLNSVGDLGVDNALVQRETSDIRPYADTAFWTLAGASVLVSSALCLCVPALARFFGAVELRGVLFVTLGAFVSNALAAVPTALAKRQLQFREIGISQTWARVSTLFLSVTIAALGGGAYSLVVPGVVSPLLGAFWLIRATGWAPRARFDRTQLRELSAFSVPVFSARVLLNGEGLARSGIASKLLPTAAFGQLYFAMTRPQLLASVIGAQYWSIGYAAFSRLAGELPRLRARYRESCELLSFVIVPTALVSALLSDLIVEQIFGAQWRPAIPAFRAFAALTALHALTSMPGMLLLVLNRPRQVAIVNALKLPLTAACVYASLRLSDQILAPALAVCAVELLVACVTITLGLRALQLPLRQFVSAHVPAFFVSALVALSALGVDGLLQQSGLPPLARLGVDLLAAVLLYFSASFVANRAGLQAFISLLHGVRTGEVRT